MASANIAVLAVSAMLGLLIDVSVANATTRFASNAGIDSGSCGTRTNPCRSISQAILNAAPGDSIRVGPGFYGDLNEDGTLGGVGDEAGGTDGSNTCLLDVSKAVKIFSTDGAGATVIAAPAALGETAAVCVATPGAELGRPNKGFTISGGTAIAVVADGGAGIKVRGNRILGSASGVALTVQSDNAVIQSNVVIGPGSLGIEFSGAGVQVVANLAEGFAVGISAAATNWTMEGNVANDNQIGIEMLVVDPTSGPPVEFDRNATIANSTTGVVVASQNNPTGGTTVTLGRGNIFANGEVPLVGNLPDPTRTNCGIQVANSDATDGITVNLDGYFWGAASGPGPDPADTFGGACSFDNATVTVNVTNPASKANSIKTRPER